MTSSTDLLVVAGHGYQNLLQPVLRLSDGDFPHSLDFSVRL